MKLNEIKLTTDIQIKTYLPFVRKKVLIEDIIEKIIKQDENGLMKVDYAYLDFCLDCRILQEYCDIDLSGDFDLVEEYDRICIDGIMNKIKTNIGEDLVYFTTLLNKEIEQRIKNHNSIAGVLARAINSLPNEKEIKKIIKYAGNTFNKLNPDNLKAIGIDGLINEIRARKLKEVK